MKSKLVADSLPGVLWGSDYVVFSPYSQSLAIVDENRVDDPETIATLRRDGFLGQPLKGGPGDHSPFYDLTLVVTGDCNLRCRYCFAKGGDISGKMAIDVAEMAVEHAIDTNPKEALSVNFFGGEPSMCSGLLSFVVDLVEAQCPYEYQFGITTNGAFAPSFADFLAEHAFRVTISADGPPKVQDTKIHSAL